MDADLLTGYRTNGVDDEAGRASHDARRRVAQQAAGPR